VAAIHRTDNTALEAEAEAEGLSIWPFSSDSEAEKCTKSIARSRCKDQDSNCAKCVDTKVALLKSDYCTFAFVGASAGGLAGSRCVSKRAEFDALAACAKKTNPSLKFDSVKYIARNGAAQCANTGTLTAPTGGGIIDTIKGTVKTWSANRLTDDMKEAVRKQDCDLAQDSEAEYKEETAKAAWGQIGADLHDKLRAQMRSRITAARDALKSKSYGRALRAAAVAVADRSLAKSIPKGLEGIAGQLLHKGKCQLLRCMLLPNSKADIVLKQVGTNALVGKVLNCAICVDKSPKAFFVTAGMNYLGLKEAATDLVTMCDKLGMGSGNVAPVIDELTNVYELFTNAFISLKKTDIDKALSAGKAALKRIASSVPASLKNVPENVMAVGQDARVQFTNQNR
jgi:hypothetical protein